MHNPAIQARQEDSPPVTPLHAVAGADALRAGRDFTLLASVMYVAVAGTVAWQTGSLALAICALGFWHYYLYVLAYRYGAVPLPVFKRDAVLMKGVALLVLAWAYLASPFDHASLATVAAGFLLNALAAAALGSDRTYYGHEVANLPRLRVTRFPYSVIAHPMLVGNMLAYTGMLLNPQFREQWWALALAHVVFNLGLLAMERNVTPLRWSAAGTFRPARGWSWMRLCGLAAAGALLAGAAAWHTSLAPPLLAAGLGAAALAYAYTLFCAYTPPAPVRVEPNPSEPESTP
jgi:hypothetical protein